MLDIQHVLLAPHNIALAEDKSTKHFSVSKKDHSMLNANELP